MTNSTASHSGSSLSLATGATQWMAPFSVPTTANSPPLKQSVGRYELQELVGEGGMGSVYRAIDSVTKETVAVKILRGNHADTDQAIRRFEKEARMLAGIQNPYVTRLIDVGVADGLHYLAMEFVEGTNLQSWMATQSSVPEKLALRIIADVARALVDAHRKQIIHRDLKPENVLLANLPPQASETCEAADAFNYQIKLTDFGIARYVRQSESMEVTRAGSLLGTPAYMSPEQCKANADLTPAADIYSLGVTLYALLTGELPFYAEDSLQLASMHCFESPIDVRRRNQLVSDAAAELVHRMLAKAPFDRPADAAQLVRQIDGILYGEINRSGIHGGPVERRTKQTVWQRDFVWDLASPPRALWPFVSNTERLNRAIGLQAVQYRTERNAFNQLIRVGAFRLAGLAIEWEEHPFEWIEGTRMGILREFRKGPFEWFLSRVELVPNETGGTRLTHHIEILPRNGLGRAIAQVEAGWKGGRALDRVYRRMDRSLCSQISPARSDRFESPAAIAKQQRRRIDQGCEQLIQSGAPFDVANILCEYLRTAPPQALAQIRPLVLAKELEIDQDVFIDVCLLATQCRLLNIRWNLLCPTCRVPATMTQTLAEIDSHTDCEACDTQFRSDVAEVIELVFQANPAIRAIDEGKYCIGGPEHSPHVVAQFRLDAGERLEATVPLQSGDYLLRARGLAGVQVVHVGSQASATQIDLRLSHLGRLHTWPALREGQVELSLENDLTRPAIVRLERTNDCTERLTAANASARALFREVCPQQVFRRDLAVTTDDLVLMVLKVAGANELYERLGDAESYVQIQQAMAVAELIVSSQRGTLVKTVGDQALAVFIDAADALSAAIGIQSRLQAEQQASAVMFNFVLHRGTCLVANQNGTLDYFGNAVRQAHALASLDCSGILLSEGIASDSQVTPKLSNIDSHAEQFVVALPGANSVRVIRLESE